ncbi:probable U6 snRNA-associated Sm-like protein LSm4 [Magnolia sinica]|uniref:probable U6 snRNA-associated Sm-like protein LSm4 n=1 Tax=Magnolia sinica TaxID=86752 RepID=UPI0026586E29|nr:probable U6 snRNA-associated Sm-like protein LSm4 [Magnolia sinica]
MNYPTPEYKKFPLLIWRILSHSLQRVEIPRALFFCQLLFWVRSHFSEYKISKMLPLSLLKTAQGHPMLVELKNGETYNGHLVNCDTWMNIHLREVICTSKDGDRFWRMPECYIRGNTIKYLRVPDEVIDKVQEETSKSRSDRKPPGVGRGRGRGREEGGSGRPAKGIGRGQDDGSKGMGGGRGRGGPGSKGSGGRGGGRGRG